MVIIDVLLLLFYRMLPYLRNGRVWRAADCLLMIGWRMSEGICKNTKSWLQIRNQLFYDNCNFVVRSLLQILVSVAAEDAEQIEEEVDEVEIQSERTKKGQLLCTFAHVGLHQEHLLNFL